MSTIKDTIKNYKLPIFVLCIYIGLWIALPEKALVAVNSSLYYVKEMLLIMPVILMLTSLIEAWVPKKTIENSFGKNSGVRGCLFSFLLGSFSAGPIYAAFPVCKMLFKKGASVSNIVIILSTWAVIKIPMLANEAKFLGPQFMAVRWILTTASIFLMGYLTSRFVRRKDIPMNSNNDLAEKSIISINQDYCIGCGYCAKIAPSLFIIENKKAQIVKIELEPNEKQTLFEIINQCPAKAIDTKIL